MPHLESVVVPITNELIYKFESYVSVYIYIYNYIWRIYWFLRSIARFCYVVCRQLLYLPTFELFFY